MPPRRRTVYENPVALPTAFDCLKALLTRYLFPREDLAGGGYLRALLGLEPRGEANADGSIPTLAEGGTWHPSAGVVEAASNGGDFLRAGVAFEDGALGSEVRFALQTYLQVRWGEFVDDLERIVPVRTEVTLTPLGDVFVAGLVCQEHPDILDLVRCRSSFSDCLSVLRAWARIRETVRPWNSGAGVFELSTLF